MLSLKRDSTSHHFLNIFLLSPGLHGIYGICLPVCWFLRPINKSWHPKTCPWRREKLGDSCLRWVHATEAHLTACARWCSPVIYKSVRNSHELMDDISTLNHPKPSSTILNHPKPLIGVMFANLANYGAQTCRWTFSWVIARSLPWGSVNHGSAKLDHYFFPSFRVFVVDPVRQSIKIPVGIQRMMSIYTISIMSNFDPYIWYWVSHVLGKYQRMIQKSSQLWALPLVKTKRPQAQGAFEHHAARLETGSRWVIWDWSETFQNSHWNGKLMMNNR